MSKPRLEVIAGGYKATWHDEGIMATAERIKSDGRGTHADIGIFYRYEQEYSIIHQAIMTLTSTNSRGTVAKRLAKQVAEVDWDNILDALCILVLHEDRQGEPVEELWGHDISPPDYLLYPLIPLHQPTIIFGDGGVGKSYFVLLLALCMALPWKDNPLRIKTKDDTTPVLFLDWETDKPTLEWRIKCLRDGLGLPEISIFYRRCIQSLPEDLAEIQKVVIEKKNRLCHCR